MKKFGPVLYLAETRDHALGEWVQKFRGRTVHAGHLRARRRRRALVSVELSLPSDSVADLCDPVLLAELDLPPDAIASRDRAVTQGVAQRLFEVGYAGLRWWSAFFGDWHTVVLFRERLSPGAVQFGEPEPVELNTPALLDAAAWLGVEVA